MRVEKILLQQFRNYQSLDLILQQGITAFIGDNAQGKTNILEAIVLCSLGRSHRTGQEEDLIHWQAAQAGVELCFERFGVKHWLKIQLSRQGKKEIFLNGHPVKIRDLIGQLNTVLFSPEDLLLVKGVPALRRRFLDMEISQANPVYYRHLQRYNRYLQQRNTLLKRIRSREQNPEAMEMWDEGLAAEGAAIVAKRREAIKKINMLANLMHRRITGNTENLTIAYLSAGMTEQEFVPDQQVAQWYLEQWRRQRQEDIQRGMTTLGPHRDDLHLDVNGNALRAYGSQGQQRTGILAMKLAELEFIRSETGEYPVLLLDDVMSELDASRRGHLLGFIRDRIQTIITTTDETYLAGVSPERMVRIREGAIQG